MLAVSRLQYLYEASRLGTMRAAGDLLDVTTSAISRQIAVLEKELGLPLVEGGRRRVKLTEAGETVCAFYRETLAQQEAFLSKLNELRSVRTGTIDLAIGEAFITDHFSLVLRDFMQIHPGLIIRVKMSGSNSAVALVREDEAHFALIFDLPRDPKVSARVSVSQPLRVVMHTGNALAKRQRIPLQELLDQPIALPEDSFRIRQIVRDAEKERGVFFEPELVTNSMTLLKDFARSGRGVTLLPPFLAQPELLHGELVAIDTDSETLGATHISLITRLGRQLPIGAYRLMQRLESYLRSNVFAIP